MHRRHDKKIVRAQRAETLPLRERRVAKERRRAAAVTSSPRWALAGYSPRAATHVSGECKSCMSCDISSLCNACNSRGRGRPNLRRSSSTKLRPPEMQINGAAAKPLQPAALRSRSSTSLNCWTSPRQSWLLSYWRSNRSIPCLCYVNIRRRDPRGLRDLHLFAAGQACCSWCRQ